MKLQTIILGLFTFGTLATAGLFDHDKAYYDAHPKEAESKSKLCQKGIEISLLKGNMAQAEEYDKDAECVASRKSYKEYKRKLQKERYALEQKKREEEKAKKEAQFKIDYQKQLTLQKQLPYEDFVKVKKTCGFSFGTPTAECKVYNELKQKRKQDAVKELMSKYQGDALRLYRKKVCHRDGILSPIPISCDIAVEASRKNEEEQIRKLSLDKEAFKKVYTECSEKIVPLQKKMKWEQINKITRSFQCSTALAAARSYHIMGFGTVIK